MNLITYVADGRLRIATLDGDELTEVAQITWPERNGIHDAAVIATNLVGMIGLDKRPRPKAVAQSENGHVDEPVPEPRRPGRPKAGTGIARFVIPREEVYSILTAEPGLTRAEVAAEVWARHGHDGNYPEWVTKNVGNVFTQAKQLGLIENRDEGKRGGRGQPALSYYYVPPQPSADEHLPGVT
jgi:hypothetical protein